MKDLFQKNDMMYISESSFFFGSLYKFCFCFFVFQPKRSQLGQVGWIAFLGSLMGFALSFLIILLVSRGTERKTFRGKTSRAGMKKRGVETTGWKETTLNVFFLFFLSWSSFWFLLPESKIFKQNQICST